MKRTLLPLLFLVLLLTALAAPAFSAQEKSLHLEWGGGDGLLVGETARLTATLDGEPVACAWTITGDQSAAKIVSGNGTPEAVLQATAPGKISIYGTSPEGLSTQTFSIFVGPSFTVSLEDGTPLQADGKGLDRWLLVPQGVDGIRLRIDPGGQVKDSYSDRKLKPDGGSYTLTLDDTRLLGDQLGEFLKYFNTYLEYGDKYGEYDSTLDYEKYKAGAYSAVSIYPADDADDNTRRRGGGVNLTICWQAELPALETLSVRGAVFYTPFVVTDFKQQFVLDKGAVEAVVSFTASRDTARVYLQDAEFKIIDRAVTRADGGYSFTVKEADFGDEAALTRYLVLENEKGHKQIITFTGARRLVDSPDTLVDYLCLGSQYSDGGNQLTGIYGLYPEKSLIGRGFWWSPISLGNFGGYITYYYKKAIRNDPQNPYGIDFIVYGNSNGGSGFSEPGNVLVSEDGETWYTLAGSEHYEDGTKWDYQVVYAREADGSTTANGVNLPPHMYPSPENYPLHDWAEGDENSITVSGVMLPSSTSGSAAFPAFGYVDVRTNSSTAWGTGEIVTVDCRAKNPYLPVTRLAAGLAGPDNMEELYEGAGDCFDLDWAVDETGLPVELDSIHYIKVQTASLTLSTGGIGEKSTEVNVVAPAIGGAAAVGVSAPPARISVGGAELPLQAGVYQYAASVKGAFTVAVEAEAAANVYINNLRATSRNFSFAPGKGLIRVIVQDGEKEPLLYYITVNGEPLTGQELEEAIGEVLARSGAEAAVSGPDAPITRAMVAAVLYELAGEPAIDMIKTPKLWTVEELPADGWYTPAVKWAVEVDIMKGTSDVMKRTGAGLESGSDITRQQLAVMLYRYAGALDRDTSGADSLNDYSDAGAVSEWAVDAMDWAAGAGIIAPGAGGALDPAGGVTRTEAAGILQRFFAALVK